MRKVLALAEKGRYTVSPNPMVAALIVKNNKIISSGFHKRAGALHAEAIALRKAGDKSRGATLYVNMEPCSHIGRTPPCIDAIIKSGIKKVYCSMIDPNPLNNSRGIRILKKNNIKVFLGLLNKEAVKLNEVFIKYITKKIPFVTLKTAETLDGKIATKTGDSKWITSEDSRSYVHNYRRQVDGIMVGVNTILKDDPLLSSRKRKSPIKIVLDPYLKIPEDSRIFSRKSPSVCIIAILKKSLNNKNILKKAESLSKRGVLVISCPGKNRIIDLKWLLRELAELEVAHLLIEGGGKTAAGFIEKGLVDRFLFFISPKIIGGRDAITAVEGAGAAKVSEALKLKNVKVEMLKEDILITGDATA